MCVNKDNAESARGRPDRMAVRSSYRAELCVRRPVQYMTLSAVDPSTALGPCPRETNRSHYPASRLSARLPNSEVIRITYVTRSTPAGTGETLRHAQPTA